MAWEALAAGALGALGQGAAGAMNYQGTVLTNAVNYQMAKEANALSQQQAQEQMAFQERMSNSAYQRATADMRAAGINPMLAYMKGGASTPPGAQGQVVKPEATAPKVPDMMSAGLASAMEARRLKKEIEQADASIALNKAAEKVKEEEEKLTRNAARKMGAEATQAEARTPYEVTKSGVKAALANKVIEVYKSRAEMVEQIKKDPGVGSAAEEARDMYFMGEDARFAGGLRP